MTLIEVLAIEGVEIVVEVEVEVEEGEGGFEKEV